MDKSLEDSLIWNTQLLTANRAQEKCTVTGTFLYRRDPVAAIIYLQKEGPRGINNFQVEIPPDSVHLQPSSFYPHPDGKSVGFSFFTPKGRVIRIYDSEDGELLFESDPNHFLAPQGYTNYSGYALFVEYLNDGTFLISYGHDYSLLYKNYQLQGVLIHGAEFVVPSLEPFPVLSRDREGLRDYIIKSLSVSPVEGYSYQLRDPVMSKGNEKGEYRKILESDPYYIEYNGTLGTEIKAWRGREVIKHTVTVGGRERERVFDPKLGQRLLEYRELFSSETLNGLIPSSMYLVTTEDLIVLRLNNLVNPRFHDTIVIVLDRRTLLRSSYVVRGSSSSSSEVLSVKACGRRVAIVRSEGDVRRRTCHLLSIYRPVTLWSPTHHSTFVKEWRELFAQIFVSLYLYTPLPREIVGWIVSLMDEMSDYI